MLLYTIVVLFVLLVFFSYYCIKFALIILKMQEELEYSLDEIDKKYDRINEILEIPVFFDSPEIKRLLSEIRDVKRVILDISIRLSKINSKDLQNEVQKIEKENVESN